MADKDKGGRPTKYDEKYCDELVEFFDRRPNTNSDGEITACEFPTFERFAYNIGVHRETILNWVDKHPSFFDAYKKAKDLQKDILIQNGLMGGYDRTFAIFTAKNVTDMRDRVEQSIEVSDKVSDDGSNEW